MHKRILLDQHWKEFFNKHLELHGENTPSMLLLKTLLKERYSSYFKFLPNGVDDFIRGMNVLPFSFESIRREVQKFKEENVYYKVEKTSKLFDPPTKEPHPKVEEKIETAKAAEIRDVFGLRNLKHIGVKLEAGLKEENNGIDSVFGS